jgi:hypothetical protein
MLKRLLLLSAHRTRHSTRRAGRLLGFLAKEASARCLGETGAPRALEAGTQCGHAGTVQVIAGDEIAGIVRLTPDEMTFPLMIVAPTLTVIGPTLGGTNVITSGGEATEGVTVLAAPALIGATSPAALSAAAIATRRRRLEFIWMLLPGWRGSQAELPGV